MSAPPLPEVVPKWYSRPLPKNSAVCQDETISGQSSGRPSGRSPGWAIGVDLLVDRGLELGRFFEFSVRARCLKIE